ncbi:MAG: HD domain-containing protein [Oligoflexia bacterium]|nr:HD domain-containing protein [Oligoflexia bacterium]
MNRYSDNNNNSDKNTNEILSDKPKILIVVDSDNFLHSLRNHIDIGRWNVEFANNFKAASMYLNTEVTEFNCIIINPSLENKNNGLLLLKSCHEFHNSVSIYLLNNHFEDWIDQLANNNLGIQGVLKTPDEIINVIEKIEAGMVPVTEMKKNIISLPQNDLNNDYIPIKTQNFIAGQVSYYDIYICLGKNKYLKLINSGDLFDCKRFYKYKDKGLNYLFIKKEDQEEYLGYCESLMSCAISSHQASSVVKTKLILNYGNEVIKFLKIKKLDERTIEYATNYTDNVWKHLDKIKKNNSVLKDIFKNISNYDHVASTTFIAGIAGRAFGLESSICVEILGLGALLHDIGLVDLLKLYTYDPTIDILNNETLIELEIEKEGCPNSRRNDLKKLYYLHPERGAEILSQMDKIHPTIIQIVAQHHNRIDGSGFPAVNKGTALNPLSQLVGISDEFTRLIKLHDTSDTNKIIKEFSKKISSFQMPIRNAFLSICCE